MIIRMSALGWKSSRYNKGGETRDVVYRHPPEIMVVLPHRAEYTSVQISFFA